MDDHTQGTHGTPAKKVVGDVTSPTDNNQVRVPRMRLCKQKREQESSPPVERLVFTIYNTV